MTVSWSTRWGRTQVVHSYRTCSHIVPDPALDFTAPGWDCPSGTPAPAPVRVGEGGGGGGVTGGRGAPLRRFGRGGAPAAGLAERSLGVVLGLGQIAALYYRSSTLYHIH
jgi:hypothetical protein